MNYFWQNCHVLFQGSKMSGYSILLIETTWWLRNMNLLFWKRCSRWGESDPVATLWFPDCTYSLIISCFGVIFYSMDLPAEMGHADIVLNFLQPTLLCFSILCIHIRVKSIPYLLLLKAELYGLDNREE